MADLADPVQNDQLQGPLINNAPAKKVNALIRGKIQADKLDTKLASCEKPKKYIIDLGQSGNLVLFGTSNMLKRH